MTATGPKECPKANVLNCLPKRSQPKANKMLLSASLGVCPDEC